MSAYQATSGRTDAAVLHVGCGNSLLPEAMRESQGLAAVSGDKFQSNLPLCLAPHRYDHGYKDVTNIDIAEARGVRSEFRLGQDIFVEQKWEQFFNQVCIQQMAERTR